jgi:hypothetical protein
MGCRDLLQLQCQTLVRGVKIMYVLTEFHPYEGHSVMEFDSKREAKIYIQKAKAGFNFKSQYYNLYEVVQEIDVNEFMKET